MKKKRLSVFSLLIALTLTLGACDDIEDRYPTESGSDESSELAGDEDPSSGVNPNENENEGNNPSSNKDVTISFTPSVITVKENDTAYFTVTLSDEEAYILSVNAEDPTYIEVGASETDNQYYVKGLAAGSTSVIITAGGEGFNTATASISVTVESDSTSEDPGGSGGSGEGGDSGEGGGSGSGGDSGEGEEPGGGEVLTDITLIFEKTEYDLTVGDSEVLEFSVSPSDEAISINMASLNGNIASASKNSEGQWCVSAHSSGDTTISVTASGTGYNSATASLSVHVIDGYTYSFSISNKESVPTDWKFNDEETFTIEPTLTTYKNEVFDSSDTLTSSDVTVTISPEDVVKCDGLTLSPVGVGTATVTVTYTGEYELTGESSDSFTISVADDYETTHSLSIDKTNLPTEVTIGSDNISLVGLISLTTTTTSLSSSEASSEKTTAQSEDVTINVTGEGSLTRNGLTLVPSSAGSAVVTVTWTAYADEVPAPTDSFEVTVLPKEDDTYSMTITNKDALEAAWYTEDDPRTIEISIMNVTQSQVANENNENISVTPAAGGIVDVNGLTLTPIGKGETDVYVEWSEHTDAHATFHVSVDEYTYTLTITTPDDYTGTWDIEDGAKDFGVTLWSNNSSANTTVSSETLSVTCNEENAFTIAITSSGFTLTPNVGCTGSYTVTATWIGHDSAVSSLTIEITDSIKPVSIQVSPSTLTLEVGQPETVSAAVYGKDGVTLATNQAVEWSASTSGIISISTNADYSATITAIDYGASVTLYATSLANHDVVGSCYITTNEKLETGAPVVLPMNKEVIETDPADNSVYVLGTGGFNQYYETGLVTSSYDSATPVRVYKTEDGYLLYIDGEYLKVVDDTSVSLTSEVNEASEFSIGNNGITYSDTPLAITSEGKLVLSEDESPLFLVDIVIEETSSLAVSGTFYLSITTTSGVRRYAETLNSSNRLVTTDNFAEAMEFTLEATSTENQYYFKRASDGNYLVLSTSANTVSFNSSSSSASKMYYDSDSGYWYESTGEKYLCYNSGVDDVGSISSYSSTSYPAAELYAVPTLPELKGITVTAPESEIMLGGEEKLSYELYPSCYPQIELNWTATDTEGNMRTDVSVSSGVIDVDGDAELGTIVVTASYGNISNSIEIEITGVSYIESDSVTFSTLGYSDQADVNEWVATLSTTTFSKGSATTHPKYYDNGSSLRMYKSSVMTFNLHEGVSYPISYIEIDFTANGYADSLDSLFSITNATAAYASGSNTKLIITPTDGLKEIEYTVGTANTSSNNHCRVNTITIYYSQS